MVAGWGPGVEGRLSEGGHCSVWGCRGLTALELLLNRMVNRPTVDFESARLGHTAMSWAAYHGRLTTIQLLAERGADVKRYVTSRTSSYPI